jgi:hypothetical protein
MEAEFNICGLPGGCNSCLETLSVFHGVPPCTMARPKLQDVSRVAQMDVAFPRFFLSSRLNIYIG